MSAFLLACVSVSAVVLIRPRVAGILYLSSYLLIIVICTFVATPEQLFFIKTNSLNCICVGMLESSILWRASCANLLQSRKLEAQKHVLEQMAYYDALTGLTNRRFLDAIIQQECALNQTGSGCTLIMLDLDDFKHINDTYGHPAGDALLHQLADVLQKSVRKTDYICRVGGEEFIALLPLTDEQEALVLAEAMRVRIEKTAFLLPIGQTEHITASLGVAHFEGTHQLNPYLNVNLALYSAKSSGKNRVIMMNAGLK